MMHAHPFRLRRSAVVALVAVCTAVLGACGDDDATDADAVVVEGADGPDSSVTAPVVDRLDALDAAVDRWMAATTIVEAQLAAVEARDLVVGDDRRVGLLPGRDGHAGLATDLASCPAVDRDLLGGSWTDPSARWAILDAAIVEWRPDNNTFPSLPSHPQRVVGWATLTIDADALEVAHEYAGHAAIHVRVSREAVATC